MKKGHLRAPGAFRLFSRVITHHHPAEWPALSAMTEDAAAAKLRANLKRIKGKLTDVNQLISQYTQVKQEKLTLQGEVARW